MATRFSAYFTYSELNGGIRATFEQFRAALSQLNGPAVIYVCGVMNAVITDWQGNWRTEAHEELVRNSFAPQFAELIISAGRDKHDPRFVFHRQQLLFVCKQALLICPDSGGNNPLIPPHSAALGRVLLMANDLLPKGLSPTVPTLVTADQMINVLSELIPVAEASGTYRAINKIVRSRIMFDRFLPNRDLQIQSLFEKATGISVNDYFALCFATLCRYSDLDWKKYKADPGNYLLSEHWYKTTTASVPLLGKFLAEISATPDGFRSAFVRKEDENDFTCFRRKPILQDKESYFVIDSLFLAEKIESGIFWRINEALPQESRSQFHQDWGLAFERYVNWLLAECADKSLNDLHPNPVFSDTGKEVCDAFVVCGDSLLFIESKGTTFTAKAKYGTEPTMLRQEIEEKFVETTEARKGVGQLALRIEEVFNRERPRLVEGLNLSKINTVFPVLITRDDIGSVPVINAYLASRFRDLFHRKSVSVRVTPPHSLSAQDLEMVCGYLRETSLADLLEERYHKDKGLFSSFWMVENSIIERIGGRECQAFSDALSAFFRNVAMTLFPKNANLASGPTGGQVEPGFALNGFE